MCAARFCAPGLFASRRLSARVRVEAPDSSMSFGNEIRRFYSWLLSDRPGVIPCLMFFYATVRYEFRADTHNDLSGRVFSKQGLWMS